MRIRFSETNKTHEIPNRYGENKSVGFFYTKNLMAISEDAELNIVKHLNENSKIGNIILSNDESIKILNTTKGWFEDDSSKNVWNMIISNTQFNHYFCIKFDNMIRQNITNNFKKYNEINKKSYIFHMKYSIELNNEEIIIDFPKVMIKKISMSFPL